MRKVLFLLILLAASIISRAQSWVDISSQTPQKASTQLLSSNIDESVIKFSISGYSSQTVTTLSGNSIIPEIEGSTRILEASAPDLPKLSSSLIIPDKDAMKIEVISSSFVEYTNIMIAPSKGNFTRDINPSSVPYTFGSAYSEDVFYPGKLCQLDDPYILRDYRGQAVQVYPFQYNPVTKVLRVYSDITVKVSKTKGTGMNPFIRSKALTAVDTEFSKIYKEHFLNYQNSKYTPLEEHGSMLIICYDTYMSAMQPFVDWKNTIGIPTEMINVAAAGGTAAAIKTYIANYYNTHGLTFLLLVGDAAQIPTLTVAGGGSDNSYGYILGGTSDHYQEVIVGRFSAENIAHVQTQVNRTIKYEKTPSTIPGLFNKCISIGSDQGPGDDNEMDFEHQRNILTDLMAFTYTSKYEFFDGNQGGQDATGNPTPAQVAVPINAGAGIITYTGHGSDNSWGTSGFSNTNITTLTNTSVWPFIFSVACVNGNFTAGTCFAEGWLRATSGTQITGAVATLMSTINQSWNPPMEGQDEMVDILTESTAGNIKRSFGGISVNGLFKMNDTYQDYDMTDTWTVFGDPSVMVRTADPMTMSVSHDGTVPDGTTQLLVSSNVEGAYICLTVNHQIIGTGTISGGSTLISFNALSISDTVTVAGTAFNYIPYLGEVTVLNISLPLDAQLFKIISPASTYNCENLSIVPNVVLKNMGLTTLTSAEIKYTFDGAPVSTINWTGNLASLASDTISLAAIILSAGIHTYEANVTSPNGGTDGNSANDSKSTSITVNNIPVTADFSGDITTFCEAPAVINFTNLSTNALSYLWDFGDGSTSTQFNPTHTYNALGTYSVTLTADAGVCGNAVHPIASYINIGALPPTVSSSYSCVPAALDLSATGSGTVNWYDAASGGNLIFTGQNYTTPLLNTSTTYYVQNVEANSSAFGGMLTNSGTGQNYNQTTTRAMIFDCYKPCKLISVKVFAVGAANRTIELENSAGTVLQTLTVAIPDGESTVVLNFDIPIGTNLQLIGSANCNLYRNNGTIAYPFQISNLISITASNSSTPLGYYYFFYNWEVKQNDCVSAMVPVNALINPEVTANFSYQESSYTFNFANTSVNADSVYWDFGNGNYSSMHNPSNTYSSNGSYTVTLYAYNNCNSDTIVQTVHVSVGLTELIESNEIVIYPNPISNQSFINIDLPKQSSLITVFIFDLTGKMVSSVFEHITSSPGIETFRIPLMNIKQGMYIVQINIGGLKINKKLLISE